MSRDAFTLFQNAVADLKASSAEATAAGDRMERAPSPVTGAVASEAAERWRLQQLDLWNAGKRLCVSWRERVSEVVRRQDAPLARATWGELGEEWQTAREVVGAFPWLEDCLGPTLAAMAALRDERPT